MKTYLQTMTATLVLASLWVERTAPPVQADAPQVFQASQFAADGGAGRQPPPSYPGGPAYSSPDAYPSGCGPAYSPYTYPGGYDPAAGPCGSCPSEESPGCVGTAFALIFGGQWRVSADAVLMQRGSPGSQTLFRSGILITDPVVFNANQLQFPMVGGFGASATRCGPFSWDIELTYTQVDAFRAYATLPGTVFLEADAGNDFHSRVSVNDPQIENTSQLRSGEANVWRHAGERVRFLTGFRWIEFNDQYNVSGIGPFGPFSPAVVTLNNNALNDLYGGQIGADIILIEWGRLIVGAGGKVGAYANSCSQESRLVDTGNLPPFVGSVGATGQHPAFLGEINALLTFEVIMDRWFVRAGYQVLWVDGVLLAPEQIAVNNIAQVAADFRFDTVFFHGAHLGMELRF